MPLDERMLDQNDPNIDTIADLQRSITSTLTYIMGRASVAELYGLQGYLSKLASQMAPAEAVRFDEVGQISAALRQQLKEVQRQQRMQEELSNCSPAPYRQEG
jgi:hypothetical protein